MKAINPATGVCINDYPDHGAAQVERAIQMAVSAYATWRYETIEKRSRLMRAAAGILRSRRSEFAEQITAEMGKAIVAAEAEIDKCAYVCDFFAENAYLWIKQQHAASDATRSYIRYDPLGPILAIMPWNFPFWQVFRFAAPTLMAGNVALLKHASNVPGCALAIERVFADAGFPAGVFTSLLIIGAAAEDLIDHSAIQAVSLTGSEQAGRKIAARAGRAIKKCVLELGGSDPFIVLADADIESAAANAVTARCVNSGQSCIAAKRFIVDQAIAGEFERAFVSRMRKLRVGDPTDRQTDVGPLAREDLLNELHSQVTRSLSQGAQLRTGGRRLQRDGFYYEPTVLADVRPGMAVFDDETFGPVAAIVAASGVDEIVELANRSRFGLGASIWTANTTLAEQLASRIEAGSVFVNGIVKSDPRLPFGGVKRSGYGRELAEAGIREFVNVKTVWIHDPAPNAS